MKFPVTWSNEILMTDFIAVIELYQYSNEQLISALKINQAKTRRQYRPLMTTQSLIQLTIGACPAVCLSSGIQLFAI